MSENHVFLYNVTEACSLQSERVWLEKQLDCAHPLVLNNGAPISSQPLLLYNGFYM